MLLFGKEIEEIDWNFSYALKEKTSYSTHNFLTYTSKYIPQIPHNIIKTLSKPGDMVLDNFCGSGTTLLESSLLNRNSIGIDINPLACLLSKVKTTPIEPIYLHEKIGDILEKIRNQIVDFEEQKDLFYSQNKDDVFIEETIESINCDFIRRIYDKKMLEKLTRIKNIINAIPEREINNFMQIAFLRILRRTSLLRGEFGNDYVARKKENKTNVLGLLNITIKNMIERLDNFSKSITTNVNCLVKEGDARNLDLKDESVNIIVTHPPYVSAVPYAEYQKLELLWLGRDYNKLDKTVLGGQRSRTDVVARFEDGMKQSFIEMNRVLKPNSYCCIVIGNPKVHGKIVQCNEIFKELGKEVNFRLVKEVKRSKKDTTHAWHTHEYILFFNKS